MSIQSFVNNNKPLCIFIFYLIALPLGYIGARVFCTKNTEFICENATQRCKIVSYNYYDMVKTRDIMYPADIVKVKVDSFYFKQNKMYSLQTVSKTGNSKEIYYSKYYPGVSSRQKKLSECLKTAKYPCKIEVSRRNWLFL